MKSKRRILLVAAAALVLLLLAGVMLITGRGHTVYFDNKSIEYDGKICESLYKVNVYVDGKEVAKLYDNERGMSTWMGQNFKMILKITSEKGGDDHMAKVGLRLPYGMDGVVINIPALLAGLPAEAYLSQFVSLIPEPVEEEEELIPDDFGLSGVY